MRLYVCVNLSHFLLNFSLAQNTQDILQRVEFPEYETLLLA